MFPFSGGGGDLMVGAVAAALEVDSPLIEFAHFNYLASDLIHELALIRLDLVCSASMSGTNWPTSCFLFLRP